MYVEDARVLLLKLKGLKRYCYIISSSSSSVQQIGSDGKYRRWYFVRMRQHLGEGIAA